MGREAFLTMYQGQKWTMAMYCAGLPMLLEDNQSPVFITSFLQESNNKTSLVNSRKNITWTDRIGDSAVNGLLPQSFFMAVVFENFEEILQGSGN